MSKYIKLEDIEYRDILYAFATDEELLVATKEDIESLPTLTAEELLGRLINEIKNW